MKFNHRRAVSPIIATLLLIAIAVAAGIVVYVYVNSLAGGLTGGGGNQETQQIQLQSYAFFPLGAHGFLATAGNGTGQLVDAYVENVGGSSVSIAAVYFDGTALTEWGISSGAYGRELVVPNSAGVNCFAAISTSVLPVAHNAATSSQTSSGSATACTPENAATAVNCTSTNFCIDTGATAGNQNEQLTIAPQNSIQIVVSLASAATAGTSHTIKIVTATGGQTVFTVVAGRTG